MRRLRLAVVAGALLLVGCSSPQPAPAATSEAPSTLPSDPTASATVPSPSTPAACPSGSYRITSFEGSGNASAVKGSGGNIAAGFDDGTFTISSDGSQPSTVDLGIAKAQLRFTGEIVGTYAGEPSALVLSTTSAKGDATAKGFGISRTYSVAGLADQLIGRSALAQVTCDDAAGTMDVELPSVHLSLARS